MTLTKEEQLLIDIDEQIDLNDKYLTTEFHQLVKVIEGKYTNFPHLLEFITKTYFNRTFNENVIVDIQPKNNANIIKAFKRVLEFIWCIILGLLISVAITYLTFMSISRTNIDVSIGILTPWIYYTTHGSVI